MKTYKGRTRGGANEIGLTTIDALLNGGSWLVAGNLDRSPCGSGCVADIQWCRQNGSCIPFQKFRSHSKASNFWMVNVPIFLEKKQFLLWLRQRVCRRRRVGGSPPLCCCLGQRLPCHRCAAVWGNGCRAAAGMLPYGCAMTMTKKTCAGAGCPAAAATHTPPPPPPPPLPNTGLAHDKTHTPHPEPLRFQNVGHHGDDVCQGRAAAG